MIGPRGGIKVNERMQTSSPNIYAAGESPIENVTARGLYEGIRSLGHRNAHYISDRHYVVGWLRENTMKGDLVITMGAGDVWRVGEEFLIQMQREKNGED